MNALPGLPGGPPSIPQKQTVYANIAFQVQPTTDGGANLIFVVGPGETVAFPLDQGARNTMGQQLLAPSVAMPNGRAT